MSNMLAAHFSNFLEVADLLEFAIDDQDVNLLLGGQVPTSASAIPQQQASPVPEALAPLAAGE